MSRRLPILQFGEIDSTQCFLSRHPELGFCAVLADFQNAGRGRGDNRWESLPESGLWLSAALPLTDLTQGLILQRAMMGVIEVLAPLGLHLGLKWPNDLVGYSIRGGPPASKARYVPPEPPAPCRSEASLDASAIPDTPPASKARYVPHVQPYGPRLEKPHCGFPPSPVQVSPPTTCHRLAPMNVSADGARQLVKLGGIIGEIKGNRMILGLGINLKQAPQMPERAIPPACLADLGVTSFPATMELAKAILETWQDLSILRPPGFFWPEVGENILWEDGNGRVTAWMKDGRLGVETKKGPLALALGDLSPERCWPNS